MITYDEDKRLSNIQKHGIDFAIAEDVFKGFHFTQEDTREAYGEARYITFGLWQSIVVVVVAHTPRNNSDHIISIRKAKKHEQRQYWQHCPY
jgi:uncharacterized DUF497 family protein